MAIKEPALLELRDPEADLAVQAFHLYETSFPIEERTPTDLLIASIRQVARGERFPGCISHFRIAVEDNKVIGISIYSYYQKPRIAFLGYLAIQPDLRGRGLGSWLLERTVEQLSTDAHALGGKSARGMCWEVERPEDSTSPEEQARRERRIDFYKRNGAHVLSQIKFTAPPLAEGLPPVPYYLMFMPVPGELIVVDKVLEKAVIEAILVYGYGLDRGVKYYQEAISSISIPKSVV
jgi:GNAT superfamily N-acetyltransferase